MSTDLIRTALNGPTMGTRWSVVVHAPQGQDLAPLSADFQAAVDEVDDQMSTWKPDSDLMRFNRAPVGAWVALPDRLMTVLKVALEIGRASDGAFEIAMGDAIRAWGFGPVPADPQAIAAARAKPRRPSFEKLDLDPANGRARKAEDMQLDLCGIAKGYGVDRLIEVAQAHGLRHALASIDGEVRALGGQPDGRGWTVALERPDHDRRTIHSMFDLHDVSVATSGDYRHWVEVGGRRLAHTMDPRRGAPLLNGPASVSVLADCCIEADALASACMVLGETEGRALAERRGAEVLYLWDADRKPACPATAGTPVL